MNRVPGGAQSWVIWCTMKKKNIKILNLVVLLLGRSFSFAFCAGASEYPVVAEILCDMVKQQFIALKPFALLCTGQAHQFVR